MEQWRAVVGWEGIYEVSDLGGVRRIRPYATASVGRNLEGTLNTSGYSTVYLCDTNRRVLIRPRHILVTEAFIGLRPLGLQVNHRDGNKLNNTLSNLEYVTKSQNMKHAGDNGLMNHGETVWTAKLTESEVTRIRQLHAEGLGYRKLTKLFAKVTRASIRAVVLRRAWRHV